MTEDDAWAAMAVAATGAGTHVQRLGVSSEIPPSPLSQEVRVLVLQCPAMKPPKQRDCILTRLKGHRIQPLPGRS